MIYRYIYKITCTTGSFKDKFYYGQHTTEDLNDGYKGSGILIKKYYKKYPNDYIKEIIAFYDTEEELNDAERSIIHSFLDNNMCLNIASGGHGGFTGNPTEETRTKISNTLKGRHPTEEAKNKMKESAKYRPPISEETRMKHRIAQLGRKYSDESKQKVSKSQMGHIPWTKGLKFK